MAERFEVVLRGGTLCTPGGSVQADLWIRDGRIAALGSSAGGTAECELDVRGLTVLPGVIDTQVHFREPGAEHKEDLESGSRAAVLGGVTAVFEMPNTKPLTTDPATLADKLARAAGRMWCDHAFYMGATAENADRLGDYERLPGCAGVKIFMGASTGDLLVDREDDLERVVAHTARRFAVHAEDEPRMRARKGIAETAGHPRAHPEWRDATAALLATQRIVGLARKYRRRVHLLHVSTADEMRFLAEHKDVASVEVTPQHLTLEAPDCYERLGTRAQMNPPIRSAEHRRGLWWGLEQGVVDVLGSDHAPHTREEKSKPYPQSPSGMTGVQTLVPVMLDHVHHGRLSLERFVDLSSAGPARLFGMTRKGRIAVGFDADLTVVDLAARRTIEDSWIASKSAWTPYHGLRVTGWPVHTLVRGHVVVRDGALQGSPVGRPVRFDSTAPSEAPA